MGGWEDMWMDGGTERCIVGRLVVQLRVGGWMGGYVDGWRYRKMDRWEVGCSA